MPVVAVISAVWGLVVLAVLLGVMASAVHSGGLERNSLMGVRTKATMHCDECWRVGHRAAEPGLRRAGWVAAVAAVVCVVLALLSSGRSWGEAVTLTAFGVSYAGVVAVLLHATVVAGRAARAVHPRR
ncbi:SdpI family protein [Kineococcus sp. SYSU DK018]|uniref:SdpI family protein n=1 Tax=Kineococcus sp. SYSU DK018 TaxID=3383139 RepID=UPI003D7CBAA7